MKSKLVVQVEFGDTDPAAIVFYPNFFRWYDAASWRLFVAAGLTLDVLRDEFGLIGLPIADASSRFIEPARFGDTIEITSHVSRWKRKSFEVEHAVMNDGRECAVGAEVRVCAQYADDQRKDIRAVTVPDEIRRRLSSGP